MNAIDKIIEYGQSIGIMCLNVDDLIQSHKAMRDYVRADEKTWRESLETARQRAYQQVLDRTWIRIEDLKKMSVKELMLLLND